MLLLRIKAYEPCWSGCVEAAEPPEPEPPEPEALGWSVETLAMPLPLAPAPVEVDAWLPVAVSPAARPDWSVEVELAEPEDAATPPDAPAAVPSDAPVLALVVVVGALTPAALAA